MNGRVHSALEIAELHAAVPLLHRGIVRSGNDGHGVEARFDAALLRRLDEHAPSLRLRTCGGDWTFTPAQVAEFRKLRRAYDALLAEN